METSQDRAVSAAIQMNVSVGRDGTWLEFKASTGEIATLRIEALAENRPGIVGIALRQWCADRQEARS